MSISNVTGLVFSKDRAMQLDAALSSLFLHCRDIQNMDLHVLHITSDSFHEKHYNKLMGDYAAVKFLRENNFKKQVHSSIETYEYVLFLVDDTIFARDFSIRNITENLKNNDALGFSLRLGKNTVYCYSRDISQELPDFIELDKRSLKYDWTNAQGDFGYPLEISSSVYRVNDILPLLHQLEFINPNTLEGQMAANRNAYINKKNHLICNEYSIAFSNPVNIVQNVCNNRVGSNPQYSADELSQMFEQGYRIDVKKYNDYVPNACHQEVELKLKMEVRS